MKRSSAIILASLFFISVGLPIIPSQHPTTPSPQQQSIDLFFSVFMQQLTERSKDMKDQDFTIFLIHKTAIPKLQTLNTIPTDNTGKTLLHLLVKMNWTRWEDVWDPELAKEINIQDASGNTPLDYAYIQAKEGNDLSTIAFLEKKLSE